MTFNPAIKAEQRVVQPQQPIQQASSQRVPYKKLPSNQEAMARHLDKLYAEKLNRNPDMVTKFLFWVNKAQLAGSECEAYFEENTSLKSQLAEGKSQLVEGHKLIAQMASSVKTYLEEKERSNSEQQELEKQNTTLQSKQSSMEIEAEDLKNKLSEAQNEAIFWKAKFKEKNNELAKVLQDDVLRRNNAFKRQYRELQEAKAKEEENKRAKSEQIAAP